MQELWGLITYLRMLSVQKRIKITDIHQTDRQYGSPETLL